MIKLLFLGASNTDCDHCFSPDNLGYGYVKETVLRLKESLDFPEFTAVNGGTDGFTFPRIYQKWKQNWSSDPFDAAVILGGINEVGAMMDSGMTDQDRDVCLNESSAALRRLLLGLSESGCSTISLMEPFLFDRPEYLRTWQPVLHSVRRMILDTSASMTHSGSFSARIAYLNTQSVLDRVAEASNPELVSADGIHLTPYGHRILAEHLTGHLGSLFSE